MHLYSFSLHLLRNQWKRLLCLISRNFGCLLQLLAPELAQIAEQQDEQKLHTWTGQHRSFTDRGGQLTALSSSSKDPGQSSLW